MTLTHDIFLNYKILKKLKISSSDNTTMI